MGSESTELTPVIDETAPDSAPSIPLRQGTRRIITARWRDIITVVIIVIDFYFVYASFSLISVFFPAEVRYLMNGFSIYLVSSVYARNCTIAILYLPVIDATFGPFESIERRLTLFVSYIYVCQYSMHSYSHRLVTKEPQCL